MLSGIALDRLNRIAAVASVGTASILIVAKLAGWIATGSVALLASLADSCIDALASLATLFIVQRAAEPPDRAHRYGHGKAEPIGALLQAAFLTGSALIVTSEAIQRLITPEPLTYRGVGIAVMVVAILLTSVLVLFQRAVIRRTGSLAIGADRVHYLSDLFTNLAVIGAIGISWLTDWPYADPLFACLIVAFLLRGAASIGRRALDMLMDRELPPPERAKIHALAANHPDIRGVHDLRTRRAGSDVFIEVHLEIDGRLPLSRAHEIAHEVEDRILGAFPGASVALHQEPAGLDDERLDAQIAAAHR